MLHICRPNTAICRYRSEDPSYTWSIVYLHTADCNLYSRPNVIRVIKCRRMTLAEHVARMSKKRGVYRVLVGKSEGKRQLGRPRRRWEDNIEMDLQEVGWGCMDWFDLAQDVGI